MKMSYGILALLLELSINICTVQPQHISRSIIDTSTITNNSHTVDDNNITFLMTYELVDATVRRHPPGGLSLNVRAFGTHFRISLREDKTLLANTKIFITKKGRTFSLADKPSFYRGTVVMDGLHVESDAYGTVIDGAFQGSITVPPEVYYIDPLDTYFKHRHGSIIYRRGDVRVPFVDRDNSKNSNTRKTPPFNSDNFRGSRQFSEHVRKPRGINFNRPRSCGMLMFSDHRFHREIGHGDLINTIKALIRRFREADKVFRGHDFNADHIGDNFGFLLETIHVHEDDSETEGYPFAIDSSDSDPKLEAFNDYAQKYYDKHCIIYGFTHEHWDNGVVGMAYTGKTGNLASGLCATSGNVGMVTSMIHHRVMTTAAHILVFIHELGHSSGSDHDETYEKDDPDCKHPTSGGLYIMTTYTVPDPKSKPNSFTFSVCSKSAIMAVLKKRMRSKCFTLSAGGSRCGNLIVEPGEECDCGLPSQCDDVDPCCVPSRETEKRGSRGNGTSCTVRREKSYVCSPKMSQCCTEQCQVTRKNKECRKDTDCRHSSSCDTVSPDCPTSKRKDDQTPCSDGLFCKNGSCSMSICELNGMTDCTCKHDETCIRCCAPADASTCEKVTVLFKRLGYSLTSNTGSEYMTYGSRCSSTSYGMCDQNHECHVYKYDTNRVFLSDLFDHSAGMIWMQNNWYYIFLLVFLVAILAYFFRGYMHCRKIDYTGNAKRIGRVLAIDDDVTTSLAIIHERKSQIENSDMMPTRRSYLTAMHRLQLLFPCISDNSMTKVVRMSSSENVAVKQLLVQEAAMVRIFGKPESRRKSRNQSTRSKMSGRIIPE